MKKLPFLKKIQIAQKSVFNMISGRPLAVSFELTLSCVCDCRHCDLGGIIKDEKHIGAADYARLVKTIKPVFVQLSGGEPLLREDIVDIAKSTKQFGDWPYVILVTNGFLLNEQKYLELRKSGVNQFSVSLDFPDQRHDDFRRRPGLYNHLNEIIPKLAKYGHDDIILNTAITRANFKEIVPLAKKAIEWGVFISYSAYTPLRTGNREYSFENKEDREALKKAVLELIDFSRTTNRIVTQKSVLLETLNFFEKGSRPNCGAGEKFVVIMPDGSMVPCSMKREKFSNLKELRENFSKNNRCGGCYVSIRCQSERSILTYIKNIPEYI